MTLSRKALCAALAAFALAAVAVSCGGGRAAAAPAPRVVIVTPGEALAPGEFRGAEALIRARAAKGLGSPGNVQHLVLPDKASAGGMSAAVAAAIAGAAADPLVRAIVAAPALPGSAEGFRRAKETRPGLLCIAVDSREDELELEASADLVVDLDRVYRAYLIPWAAKKMGAKALVALYTQEEGQEDLSLRERAIMSQACADLGLKYSILAVPPGTDAVTYTRAMTGAWLRDMGKDTALYCSAPVLVQPLIQGAIAGGGMVVDAAGETSRAAYAAALGLDLSSAKGEAKKERALLEAALLPLGGRGRFGFWDSSWAGGSVAGLGEFAVNLALGKAAKDDLKAMVGALNAASSDSAWLAAYDVDPQTGVRSANHVLLRQDVYVLGSGYLQSALQTVSAKYLGLGP